MECPEGRIGNINIPNSVTCIGQNSFAYCAKLTSITIPNSVTEIEDKAFEGSKEKILDSLRISKRYMENYVI